MGVAIHSSDCEAHTIVRHTLVNLQLWAYTAFDGEVSIAHLLLNLFYFAYNFNYTSEHECKIHAEHPNYQPSFY